MALCLRRCRAPGTGASLFSFYARSPPLAGALFIKRIVLAAFYEIINLAKEE
jgi:F0F1-type ATP synthase membrane subunit c/vacuolar-type H+-ATPase subunit K